MARQFYVSNYTFNNTFYALEVVRGGHRAVSPEYNTKAEALAAIDILRATGDARVRRQ